MEQAPSVHEKKTGKKKRLGEMLLERGLLTHESLMQALKDQKKSELKLGQYLIKNGLVSENDLVETISSQTGIQKYRPGDFSLDLQLADRLSADMARKFHAIPVQREKNILHIAMTDPLDINALDSIELYADMEVEALICTEKDFNTLFGTLYGSYTGTGGILDHIEEAQTLYAGDEDDTFSGDDLEVTSLQDMAEEAPVVKFANSMLAQAVRDGASDIHLSPERDHIQLRYRIDGKLQEVPSPPKNMFLPLVSRLKILASLDISVSRIPQDGRITVKFQNREINIRVSTMPTIYGENVVLRLLDTGSMVYSLDKLGMSKKDIATINRLLQKPYGMILATGPTGSGKSSTLFSMLKQINTPDRNIITLEDPVEYRMGKIRQAQLNKKAGMTFASGLRSIMRQDPDVVMVGEIRDAETAAIAVQAALTGHLVFSTVHTNDAAGAITRLIELGIEPFLVSSVILATIAQRLVRKVCPDCRERYRPSEKAMKFWGFAPDAKGYFMKPKGCYQCMDTGYKGRTGLYEVLETNPVVQEMILQNQSARQISAYAEKKGFLTTLKADAARKVRYGITTLEEAASAVIS